MTAFESGASNWSDDERGCMRPRARPCWSECGSGSPRPTTRVQGYHRSKFRKFYVQNEAFGVKLHCFYSKQTASLTQTFGHKWLSEGA